MVTKIKDTPKSKPTKEEVRKKALEGLTPEQLKKAKKGSEKLPPICGGVKPPTRPKSK